MMMLLSAASARTLKDNHHGGYGGYGGYGGPAPSVRPQALFPPAAPPALGRYYPFAGRTLCFHDFVICMPESLTAGRILTSNIHAKEGTQTSEFVLTDKRNSPVTFDGMAYCAAFKQDAKGPDVDVEIFLDGMLVHKANYQQNYGFLAAGDIHTNDPNAYVKKSGDSDSETGEPGVVIIKALGAVMVVNNCKNDITMTRARYERGPRSWYLMCDKENIIKLEKGSQKYVMFPAGTSFFALGGIPTNQKEGTFILDNQGTTVKFSQAAFDSEFGQFLPAKTYDEQLGLFWPLKIDTMNCEADTESVFFNSYTLGADNEAQVRSDAMPSNTPGRDGLRYLMMCGA